MFASVWNFTHQCRSDWFSIHPFIFYTRWIRRSGRGWLILSEQMIVKSINKSVCLLNKLQLITSCCCFLLTFERAAWSIDQIILTQGGWWLVPTNDGVTSPSPSSRPEPGRFSEIQDVQVHPALAGSVSESGPRDQGETHTCAHTCCSVSKMYSYNT